VLALKNVARQNGRRRVDNVVVCRGSGPMRSVDGPTVVTAKFIAASKRRLSPKAAACFVQVPLQSSKIQEAAQMQMITRRVNEGLVIENDIHVTVLDICQDYVRLAISSPNNSPPYREETLYWDDASRPTAAESAPELMLQ
jgi:carbon storage regulator CsrA